MEIISNIDGSTIELETIRRKTSSKIQGYGIWLSQGDKNDPTEYYIPDFELDEYIKGLIKVREQIKMLKFKNDSN